MNIVTEPKLAGQPIADKAHKRPVRMVRWFFIVGTLLAVLVGALGLTEPGAGSVTRSGSDRGPSETTYARSAASKTAGTSVQ